ncbi:hypothetical protein [Acetomicrobium hydrogeniformans]|nr:hypothetical protein [Acetomicrobium hydrogeniformans]
MYSKELRMWAIELYIKYGKSPADVIRKLGYPDRKMLGKWYKIYLEKQETGVPYEKRYAKVPSFLQEKHKTAVRHYLSAFLQATSMKS